MDIKVILSLLLASSLMPQLLYAQRGGARPQTAAPQTKPEVVTPKPEGPLAQPPVSVPTTVNPNSYRIGLQDEVKITVFGEDDLSGMYRVDADGFISFPLIGRVSASGVTPSEL